ncbi:hypothetical protein NQ317_006796 [Molorchus minor]|uniref:Cytochrome P450 n=1 Tax=Molorchus minor TaxID=1323400 RepID=A0ABQ9IWX8_9CUCU|nr:hypothetical protein NQ317_006796 [Molorchus minor]
MKEKKYENISEENISIVERILRKTENPKLAAVLALDLFLVGVDTTHVIFPHLVVSNIEDYIAEPDKFIPERWLKSNLKKADGCPVHQKRNTPFRVPPLWLWQKILFRQEICRG